MNKKYFTEEETQKIIRLYVDEKIGTAKIGNLFGVSKTAIQTILRNNNIPLDSVGKKFSGGKSVSNKRYAETHKKDIAGYNKEWQKENRDKLRAYHAQWRKNKKVNSEK